MSTMHSEQTQFMINHLKEATGPATTKMILDSITEALQRRPWLADAILEARKADDEYREQLEAKRRNKKEAAAAKRRRQHRDEAAALLAHLQANGWHIWYVVPRGGSQEDQIRDPDISRIAAEIANMEESILRIAKLPEGVDCPTTCLVLVPGAPGELLSDWYFSKKLAHDVRDRLDGQLTGWISARKGEL